MEEKEIEELLQQIIQEYEEHLNTDSEFKKFVESDGPVREAEKYGCKGYLKAMELMEKYKPKEKE